MVLCTFICLYGCACDDNRKKKCKGKLQGTLLIMDTWHFCCKSLVGVMASKRKRSCYDAAFKLKVVDFAEVNENRAAKCEFTILEKFV